MARQWYGRVLAGLVGKGKQLALNCPNVHVNTHNMATLFEKLAMGEDGIALEWYQLALDGRERLLGFDHCDTLSTVNNMASFLGDQGKFDIANQTHISLLIGLGILPANA